MNQFRNVLDRDDPFVSGNVLHQRLHEGCFSASGFSGYHDVLSVPDSLSQEFNSFSLLLRIPEGVRKFQVILHLPDFVLQLFSYD